MKLIDTHAHLDFDDFHPDFGEVMNRAEEAGVEKVINIGADMNRSQASITLAETFPNIYATIGVHPESVGEINLDTIHNELMELAKTTNKLVGIGETGLDYNFPVISTEQGERRNLDLSTSLEMTREAQKKLFQIHIDVARHLGLPLVVHIRNGEDELAVDEAYEILKNSDYHHGVVHCFTLGPDWTKRFVDLGFYIGFTGIITYKNAEIIREAVAVVPADRLLAETDCPFLAPQKFRGQRNEPAYVYEVVNKIAEVRGISLDDAAEITFTNAINLFQLK